MKFKGGYIKGTPELIKLLRQELLALGVGYVDVGMHNDVFAGGVGYGYLCISGGGVLGIYTRPVVGLPLIYTPGRAEAACEAAKTIYKLTKID